MPGQSASTAKPEARQNQAAAILKDTVITAVLAFAILGPIVGLKAEAPQGGLVLRERWGLALSLVGIVAAGRLLLNLLWWRLSPDAQQTVLRFYGAPGGLWAMILGLLAILASILLAIQVPLPSGWLSYLAAGIFVAGPLAAVLAGAFLYTREKKPAGIAALAVGLLAGLATYFLPRWVLLWAPLIVLLGGFVRLSARSGTPSDTGALIFESVRRNFGVILLILALLLPFLPGVERRGVDLAILMLTYVMLGWGLNIVVGLAGLLDLGYVAFYAVGAYSYALLSTVYLPKFIEVLNSAYAPWNFDWALPWAFWIVLPIAGTLAALWGIILGFPVLRLRGDYLAIVTLAFGEIIRVILINWYDFTNGPNGISDIPRPSFFGYPFVDDDAKGFIGLLKGFAAWVDTILPVNWQPQFAPIQRIIFLYYVILILALITNFVTLRLRKLPIGRAWEALREDEIACRSLGINTTNTKLTAFAMGAMFGGFAGSFFATRQGFVSPESFVFMESATILAIVVLGGLGSQIGVVVAAVCIIGAFELFRELDFLTAVMPQGFDPAQYRMLAVGIAMVLIMRWRPRGLVTTREPSIYLKEKKVVSADLIAQGRG